MGLCGCYLPGAYYAFYCRKVTTTNSLALTFVISNFCVYTFQHWQVMYMILLCGLALVSMVTQLHPQFLSAKWHLRRLFLYSSLIFAGVVPVMHWVIENGGIRAPIVLVSGLTLSTVILTNCYFFNRCSYPELLLYIYWQFSGVHSMQPGFLKIDFLVCYFSCLCLHLCFCVFLLFFQERWTILDQVINGGTCWSCSHLCGHITVLLASSFIGEHIHALSTMQCMQNTSTH